MKLVDTNGRPISPSHAERSLKTSTAAGVTGTVFFVATSGAFLASFARKLGATQFQVGLISGVMPFAGTAQLLSAYLIETYGWRRKPVLLVSMALQRLLWIPILLLPYVLGYPPEGLPPDTAANRGAWLLFGLIVMAGLLGGFGGLAWQAWIADLVPEHTRGRFFGRRTAATNAIWIASSLAIGRYLDLHNNFGGFTVVFTVAIVSGLLDMLIHSFVPEPQMVRQTNATTSSLAIFREPLTDPRFMRLIWFVAAWNLAVWVKLPFVNLYMLEDLGLSYLSIANLGTLYLVSMLIGSYLLGPWADVWGSKRVYSVSMLLLVNTALFWLISTESNWGLILVALNVYSGLLNAGANIGINQLLLENSPEIGRPAYLAVFFGLTGLFAGLGPMLGGLIGDYLVGNHISLWGITLGGYKLLFALSFLLRLFTLPLLKQVESGQADKAPIHWEAPSSSGTLP